MPTSDEMGEGPSSLWSDLVAAMRTLAAQELLLNPSTPLIGETVTTATPLESDGNIRSLTRSEKKKVRQARKNKNRADAASEARDNPSLSSPSKRAAFVKRQSSNSGGPSAQTPVKRPRRNAIPKKFTVAICREDGIPLNEALGIEVRRILTRHITDAIKQQGLRGKSLHFAMSGLVSGVFLVRPSTAEAMQWLLGKNLGTPLGYQLRSQMHNRTRINIWIPGPPEELLEDPLLYLRAQNWDREDELRIKQWIQVRRKNLGNKIRVCYSVPQSVEDTWGADSNQWLFFQATRIRAQLMRSQPYRERLLQSGSKCSGQELQSKKQEQGVQASIHQESTSILEVRGQ